MKYTKDVEKAIKKSKEIAIEIKSKTIRPEHLFLALIDNEKSNAYSILHDLNLNIDAIKQTIRDWSSSIQSKTIIKQDKNSTILLDIETDKILKDSSRFAEELKNDEVDSQHVFYSILENNNNIVTELFNKSPDTYKTIKSRINNNEEIFNEDSDIDMDNQEEKSKSFA